MNLWPTGGWNFFFREKLRARGNQKPPQPHLLGVRLSQKRVLVSLSPLKVRDDEVFRELRLWKSLQLNR
jgi:hypothetical protein